MGKGMEPILVDDNYALFSRLGMKSMHRSSVVLVNTGNGIENVGRIIALPTEAVRVENGNIYIDNNVAQWRLVEEYLPEGRETTAREERKWFRLNEFEYLVLTDNQRQWLDIPKMIVHKDKIDSLYVAKW